MSTTMSATAVGGGLVARPAPKPLDRGGLLALAGSVAVILCIAGASVWQAGRNATALAVARQTRIHRTVATDILATATAAETSQRGYLLTAQPAYLKPLGEAEAALGPLTAQALAIWPDDRRLVVLRQAVTAKMAELRRTADLAQAGRTGDAMAIVRTNSGYANMAIIQSISDQLGQEQDAKLIRQVSAISRGGRLLVAIDLAGLVMVFALAGLIGLGLRSYLAVLRAAQGEAAAAYAALERNNDQLDETVRTRTAALTAANEEIQRFAYIVSHDLRAPLVNIMGFTSELEQAAATLSRHALTADAPAELREAAEADIPEALRYIKLSSAKMDRLINAILRLSREGRRVMAAERLDMGALLADLVETMSHQAASKAAVVSVGSVPDIEADRLMVEQVFGNVVENALKYLSPGRPGEIRISGRTEGRFARYDVSDNGRGIAAKDYERVFELFRRSGDQSVPGEGIGLAHVRALVRRLGGSADCVSELDVGTTLVIRLPVGEANARGPER